MSDTSMNLWRSSLTIYLKIILLSKGQIFIPLSWSIFP